MRIDVAVRRGEANDDDDAEKAMDARRSSSEGEAEGEMSSVEGRCAAVLEY